MAKPKQPTTEEITASIHSLDTKDLITIKQLIDKELDERKTKANAEYNLISNGGKS